MDTGPFPLWTWLAVSLAGVVLLLAAIVVLTVASSVRKLRDAGIPRPFFVVWRRSLSIIPLRSSGSPRLDDRVFLAWDLRWMYGGQTTARVAAVDESIGKLELELSSPIPVVDAAGRELHGIDRVEFLPRRNAPYRWASVVGTLAPPVGEVTATAEVVWYGGPATPAR